MTEASQFVAPTSWSVYQGNDKDTDAIRRRTRLFAGNGNLPLANAVAQCLGVKLANAKVGHFADGEVSIKVEETVRGMDVYIIQSVCGTKNLSVNDTLMELLLLISCMRRAAAHQIVAVIPYFGYARQDRKVDSRVPISAADVSMLITQMGVDRVVCVDLHSGQVQGFFPSRVPVDNLNAGTLGALYYGEKSDLKNPVIVSPESGVARAKEFRRVLSMAGYEATGMAMFTKVRAGPNIIAELSLVGNVDGCDCIIVDDMVDTAGTLCEAAKELKANGATRVFAFITHGLMNGPAKDRIANSVIDELVVSNTVPLSPDFQDVHNVKQLTIASLLAETIRRNVAHDSVGDVFA